MDESRFHPSETITTLLIGYIQIQNKKLKKKRKGCYAMLSHFSRVRLHATP